MKKAPENIQAQKRFSKTQLDPIKVAMLHQLLKNTKFTSCLAINN